MASLHAAALRVELRIPGATSLKEKRRVLRALVAELSRSQTVAVAEIAHQDRWQRAALGVAVVAADASHLARMLHDVERTLRAGTRHEVLDVAVSYLEEPG